MTPVIALQYAFLEQGNGTDTKYLKQLSLVQRDFYLNRGKNLVLSIYSRLAETDSTVTDYIKELIVRDTELDVSKEKDHVLAKYPVDYYHVLGIYADASKEGCSGIRRFPVRRLTSDKIRRGLKNANTIRFWDFEETVALQNSNGFNLYTEPGIDYTVFLDYVKKVPDVACPFFEKAERYIDPNGKTITQNINLEIDSVDLVTKIVNVAVLESKRDRNLVTDYELQLKTLLNLDRL